VTNEMNLTNAHFEVDEHGVATLLLDSPGMPVNTLSPDLNTDLDTVLDRVESDPGVVALVIGSAKPDTFLAGVDLRWLAEIRRAGTIVETLTAAQADFLRLERLATEHGKPVVAAIHGPCLGGGLELALACSMRIASDDDRLTRIGLPEIQLGIIPALGGTQRLPRLIGIAAALDIILAGKRIRPFKARKLGLVDELCPSEVLLDVARTRAREAAAAGPAPTSNASGLARIRSYLSPSHLQQLALEENPMGRRLLFSKAEERMLAETKGNYPAPPAALRTVRTGIEEGLEAGYAAEVEEFTRLIDSPESEALLSIFFATREMKKDTGIDGDATARPIHKVGVLGGGLMGAGIAAINATRAHVASRIKDIDDGGVRRGIGHVAKVLDGQVKRRRIHRRDAARIRQLVTGTTDWSGFGNADLVIEAVFEDLALKQAMVQQVEAATGPDTIFASNTSSIPISLIAAEAARPTQVIGMHYFSPVEKMPLLEVIVTDQTADWVTATCVAFGKQQGKTVIVVNDGAGFYTTRVLGPYLAEVIHLLEAGASIEAIDRAMVNWGFPVGPVTLVDEVGIDVAAKIAGVLAEAYGDRMMMPDRFSRLADDDRKGRKNGRGFYLYEHGEKGGVDESIYQTLGLGPRVMLPERDIQERLALRFINEAARCLEEGIVRSARDGDVGAIYGLGFPPFRGGPFRHLDQSGIAAVVERMDALADAHGDRFRPAGTLRDHAASGELLRG
jgi:3-hydroxyacyl-CoA dehydrogenase/enoyl-CoA hydratase/3-hydroxybutyryl-CoA epimerase